MKTDSNKNTVDDCACTENSWTNVSKGRTHKAKFQPITLPGITLEFNVGHNGMCMTSSSTGCEDEERAFGTPYEDVLKKSKYNILNPCRARYRPVTPGLLETLNKLKIPPKTKTEQWIKSTHRSLKDHMYETDRTNDKVKWIYEN
jgi:hypothetical protein